jgi:hypothetical protein
VVGQHQRVVLLVDVVAGQHHHVVGPVGGQDVLVLVDGVGGAAVPAFLVHPLLRRQQVDELVHLALEEGPAALQVAQQAVALVLGDHADAADARVHAVGQRKVHDAELAAKVDRRFGSAVGQVLQPAAPAAGQHQSHGVPWQIQALSNIDGSHGRSLWKSWQENYNARSAGSEVAASVRRHEEISISL